MSSLKLNKSALIKYTCIYSLFLWQSKSHPSQYHLFTSMVSLFSAYLTPDTKAHVSYCHHLTSVFVVVFCKFFTFQSSSIQSVRLLLVLFGNSAWLTWPKMCSDRQIFQKYASQIKTIKPL